MRPLCLVILAVLAFINGLSGAIDGHHPEHYIAGAVFAAALLMLLARTPTKETDHD